MHAPAFEHARGKLLAIEGMRETLGLQGVWNWALAFRLTDAEPAAAYLIPDPARPRMCITLADERLPDLPARKTPRHVRDVLMHSPNVAGIRWPIWDMESKAQVDDLLALLEFRLAAERMHAGA